MSGVRGLFAAVACALIAGCCGEATHNTIDTARYDSSGPAWSWALYREINEPRTMTVDRAAGTVTVEYVFEGKKVVERYRIQPPTP